MTRTSVSRAFPAHTPRAHNAWPTAASITHKSGTSSSIVFDDGLDRPLECCIISGSHMPLYAVELNGDVVDLKLKLIPTISRFRTGFSTNLGKLAVEKISHLR